jgi:hypothetical protein
MSSQAGADTSDGGFSNNESKRMKHVRMSLLERKYRGHYLKKLFDGSGPVFIAAVINRAAVAGTQQCIAQSYACRCH